MIQKVLKAVVDHRMIMILHIISLLEGTVLTKNIKKIGVGARVEAEVEVIVLINTIHIQRHITKKTIINQINLKALHLKREGHIMNT